MMTPESFCFTSIRSVFGIMKVRRYRAELCAVFGGSSVGGVTKENRGRQWGRSWLCCRLTSLSPRSQMLPPGRCIWCKRGCLGVAECYEGGGECRLPVQSPSHGALLPLKSAVA